MDDRWSISGKTCVLTGATAGIGRETALGLARQGARLVLICRDAARARRVAETVERIGATVDPVIADLSSLDDVRRATEQIRNGHRHVHVLISNAGVVMPERVTTVDGLETTFAVNHLAPFLLIHGLVDRLESSAPARVIVVASQVESRGTIRFDDLQHEQGYAPHEAYFQSKLANVLFSYELARRLKGTGVTVNCLHPGIIATNLLCDYMRRPRALSVMHRLKYPGPKVGAKTALRLATDPALAGVSGRYFSPDGVANSSERSYDTAVARRLWEISADLVGVPAVFGRRTP